MIKHWDATWCNYSWFRMGYFSLCRRNRCIIPSIGSSYLSHVPYLFLAVWEYTNHWAISMVGTFHSGSLTSVPTHWITKNFASSRGSQWIRDRIFTIPRSPTKTMKGITSGWDGRRPRPLSLPWKGFRNLRAVLRFCEEGLGVSRPW